MLAATRGRFGAAPIVIAAEAPPWIGPLDVLIVAGDDPGDPVLVGAAASGVRRGARVVSPRRTTARCATHRRPGGGAGAAAAGSRRLRSVPLPGRRAGRPGKRRPPAAGRPGRPGRRPGRGGIAEQRRPRALHQPGQGAGRADVERRVVFAGDCAATLALARHGVRRAARVANEVVAAAGMADALVALRSGPGPALRRSDGVAVPRRGDRRADHRPAAAPGADAGRRAGRGDGRGSPGSTTSTWSAPRMCQICDGAAAPATHPSRSPTRRAAAGYIGCPAGDGGGLFTAGAGITGSEVMPSAVATRSDTDIRVGVADRHRGIHWSPGTGGASGGRTLAGRQPRDPSWLEEPDGEVSLLQAAARRPGRPTRRRRRAPDSATRCRSW